MRKIDGGRVSEYGQGENHIQSKLFYVMEREKRVKNDGNQLKKDRRKVKNKGVHSSTSVHNTYTYTIYTHAYTYTHMRVHM